MNGGVTFTFVPSDLVDSEKDQIDAGNVQLLNTSTTVAAGAEVNLSIKLVGVTKPGTYRGTVRLVVGKISQAVGLTVNALERPSLTTAPTAATLKLTVTNCRTAILHQFSCWLTGELVSHSRHGGRGSFVLSNGGKSAVTIKTDQVYAIGDGGEPFNPTLDWPKTIAPALTPISLHVDRDQLEPDHYSGSASISYVDGLAPLIVPVDISVRDGVFWILVLLLAGILLGRLALYMQNRGNKQSTALWQLFRLHPRIDRIHDEDAQQALVGRYRAVADLIYRDTTDMSQELTNLQGYVAIFEKVQLLESVHPTLPSGADVRITAIRDAVLRDDLVAAQSELTALQGLITPPPPTPAPAPAGAAAGVTQAMARSGQEFAIQVIGDLGKEFERIERRAAQAEQGASDLWHRITRLARWSWRQFRRAVFAVAGVTDRGSAELKLWAVRPLLSALLVLLLLGVGLQALYFGKPTFGANGFVDYFAVLLWGLSADVAGRTLTSLAGKPSG